MTTSSHLKIYPNSFHESSGKLTCYLARDEETGERWLGVQTPAGSQEAVFSEPLEGRWDGHYYGLNHENAARLRELFPWLNPVPLEPGPSSAVEQQPSFGFGDRLGLATPGHIRALEALGRPGAIAPIFAQQSVRENSRTGRPPQWVLDEAMWGVFQEGWRRPWGADADHLKQVSDLPAFVRAGYSFYTVDPGEHVDPAADSDSPEALQAKAASQPWGEIEARAVTPQELSRSFLAACTPQGAELDPESLEQAALRAGAKYGQAVIHITRMYRALQALKPGGFDFEVSVDETDSPTSVLEHFYIASELKRLGVRFTSMAPRLPGRFEKGVDYIGDLTGLEKELERHVQVMRQVGGYKLSLHSGSDKFSLYPMLARQAGSAVHVKTAGTSYLEALRVAARLEPALFRRVLELARQRYAQDRQTYHVSAEEQRLPLGETLQDSALPGLLDDFHVRQALHVTFGSALEQFGREIKAMLIKQPQAYEAVLLSHFRRHLEPLIAPLG